LMEGKIRGVEQELAMNTLPPLPHGSLVHLVGMAMEELKKKGLLTSIRVEEDRLDFMALNGFRVYNDMSHLELSSPSYNSPVEAVIYDKVAELFAFYAVQNLKSYFREVNVYKNNVSNVSVGGGWRAVSYSTHSSIIMDRSVCNPKVWDRLESALVPYMVARVPMIGGGDLVPCLGDGGPRHSGKELKGDALRFAVSPRAFFVKKISSNDTVEARGLLNQRDDPHADPEKYWRLHDINWEGLRSPFQIYLRDCLETLVMMAYEGGFLKNPPRLADPVRDIKEISGDAEECNWRVTLDGGGKVDALSEIMEGFYLAGIEEMMDEGEPNQVDRMGFNLIEATLQALGERRLENFLDGLDWVTKKALIDEHAPNDLEEALGICNQYTLLDGGVLRYLEDADIPGEVYTTFNLDGSMEFARDAIPIVQWDALHSQIGHALEHGPESTREYLRCLAAREFPFLLDSIEWESVNFYNASIVLNEPFKFSKEACGDRLERATSNLASFLQAISQVESEGEPIVYAPVDDHELREKDDRGGVNP
jgi:hypothetical protein